MIMVAILALILTGHVLIWVFKNLGTILWVIVGLVSAVICLCLFGPYIAGLSPVSILVLYLAFRPTNKNGSPL